MAGALQAVAKKLCDATGVPRHFFHQCKFEAKMAIIRCNAVMPWQYFRVRQWEKAGALRLVFGCGETRYRGWVGVDCSRGKSVDLLLDLRRKLPFRDGSVESCYSEHFMEHLYPEEVDLHLVEVNRILKPEGIYRVAVPAAIRFAQKYC